MKRLIKIVVIYDNIFKSDRKKLAVLIDPGKTSSEQLKKSVSISVKNEIDFFLTGGSLITEKIDKTIEIIKENSDIPVVLFPGSIYQLSEKADAVLFLSLISGRNPDFLIGNQVVAAPFLKKSNIEVIPAGYMLIESGAQTSVEYMSNTKPIPYDKIDIAVATATAGEFLGLKSIYLEAGSGAKMHISENMIKSIKSAVNIPVITGGGIRDAGTLKKIYSAGADIAVTGTAFEKNTGLIKDFSEVKKSFNRQY